MENLDLKKLRKDFIIAKATEAGLNTEGMADDPSYTKARIVEEMEANGISPLILVETENTIEDSEVVAEVPPSIFEKANTSEKQLVVENEAPIKVTDMPAIPVSTSGEVEQVQEDKKTMVMLGSVNHSIRQALIKQIDEGKTIPLFIPFDQNDKPGAMFKVKISGFEVLVPKGVSCTVPLAVYKVYENRLSTENRAAREQQEKARNAKELS